MSMTFQYPLNTKLTKMRCGCQVYTIFSLCKLLCHFVKYKLKFSFIPVMLDLQNPFLSSSKNFAVFGHFLKHEAIVFPENCFHVCLRQVKFSFNVKYTFVYEIIKFTNLSMEDRNHTVIHNW